MEHMNKVIELIKLDELRLAALECVRLLDLPQCYIAAGFVRNLIWDSLHQKSAPTMLNDVDVIYFDSTESNPDAFKDYELRLKVMLPKLNWQVSNQAKMHSRNGDLPYQSIIDAMSYWPEKETALAIRKTDIDDYECISAFGFESLFDLQITYNPKRNRDIFEHRVKSKKWLTQWPMLQVAS